MCSFSVVSDQYRDQFPQRWPGTTPDDLSKISREEFDALRAEVIELRKLLLAAKEYDTKTGQPDCEMDEKIAFIKLIADQLGVDMKDVLRKNNEDN